MNGSKNAEKQLLEERYNEAKEKAANLREQGKPEQAAQAFEQAANTLEEIADLEKNDYVAQQKRRQAKRHRQRSTTLTGAPEPGPAAADRDGPAHSPDTAETDIDRQAGQHNASPEASEADIPAQDHQVPSGTVTGSQANSGIDDEYMYFQTPPDVELEEVGGLDQEIDKIQDGIIKPHTHPEVYEEIGVEIASGILLHGPPGTGKTMVAKAVANALEVPYARVSAAELGSEYVNVGAQNIEKLFVEARQCQPCVVFIDELDALAQSRGSGREQSDGSRQMINQLLIELEAIEDTRVCVIGATNLIEDIDGAIRRSGRFDRKIRIGAPDKEDRREIFELHLDEKKIDGLVDPGQLADVTEGFSGADIEAVVRQAGQERGGRCVNAGKTDPNEIDGISQADLEAAAEDVEPGITQWKSEQQSPF